MKSKGAADHYFSQHIRAGISRGYAMYVKKQYPEVDIAGLCEEAGLPFEVLENPHNWVSVDFALKYLEVLKKATNDPELGRHAGRHSLTTQVESVNFLKFLQMLVPSVRAAYEIIPRITPLFNRVLRVEEVFVRSGRARIVFELRQEHFSDDKLKKWMGSIDNVQGYMEAVPTLFGAPYGEATPITFPNKPFRFGYEIVFREPPTARARKIFLLFGALTAGFTFFGTVGNFLYRGLGSASVFFATLAVSLIWRDQKRRAEYVNLVDLFETQSRSYGSVVEIFSRIFENLSRSNAETAKQLAHDIRSPIAALAAASKRARDFPGHTNALMDLAVSRIREICDQVLAASQRLVPLKPLIQDIISEKLGSLQNRASISLDGPHEVMAFVDPIEFKRIVSNLIENSIEATIDSPEKEIVISLEEDRSIFFRIKDKGPGISDLILEKVGKEPVSTKTNGHGLGLRHAFERVGSWGGKIRVASIKGKGTTVEIELPKP